MRQPFHEQQCWSHVCVCASTTGSGLLTCTFVIETWTCSRKWSSVRLGNFRASLKEIVSMYLVAVCASFKFGIIDILSALESDAELTSTFWLYVDVALTTVGLQIVGFGMYLSTFSVWIAGAFAARVKVENVKTKVFVSTSHFHFYASSGNGIQWFYIQGWFYLLKYLSGQDNQWSPRNVQGDSNLEKVVV